MTTATSTETPVHVWLAETSPHDLLSAAVWLQNDARCCYEAADEYRDLEHCGFVATNFQRIGARSSALARAAIDKATTTRSPA